MRLLRYDDNTEKLHIDDFHGKKVPFYGMLSHTWGQLDEQISFERINSPEDPKRRLSYGYKLSFARLKAAEDGLTYFWVDTYCIKKSNYSELQRSLNSMFYWYQRAARCYVLLEDVSLHDYVDEQLHWRTPFSRSRWFQRGWTLQELIAPKSVAFYSSEGQFLGDKHSLADTLSAVTGVPSTALLGADLSRFSKETRLSWAKDRVTKVPEDMAYSLMGILGVNFLPMLYADGDYKTRRRAALEELDFAFERAAKKAGKPLDVARIGGASLEQLKLLDMTQIQQLDDDLDAYASWLLASIDLPKDLTKEVRHKHRDVTGPRRYWTEHRLQKLLGNYGVGYDHNAHFYSEQHHSDVGSTLSRFRLLEATWHSCGLSAVRTFMDLKLWIVELKQRNEVN